MMMSTHFSSSPPPAFRCCPHMQPHADRRRPFPPSPGAPRWRQGAGRPVPAHAAGEQLAFHRARPDAQIVITTRREDMHYTRSVLLTMRLMQFVTCCALPFAHQSLTSALFFLGEPARWDFCRRLLFLWRIYYERDSSIFDCERISSDKVIALILDPGPTKHHMYLVMAAMGDLAPFLWVAEVPGGPARLDTHTGVFCSLDPSLY